MDIGGKDLFEMGKPLTKNEVAKVVWRFWPDLVIENCDMNDREEFFIYENPASKALWDIDCADGEAAMLYIMFDPDCLSIVVDSDGSDDHVAEAVFQAMREKNNV